MIFTASLLLISPYVASATNPISPSRVSRHEPSTRRQSIFIDDTDYQAFLDILSEANRLWGIEVFAYVLMGNHYHLCLRTPKGNLSRVMRHVDGIYTQRFNRRHGRDGTLFRGRYKAILIEADEYLAAVVRYIHLNATEAGIVKMPEDYRWAIHRYYQSRIVPNWLNTGEAVEQIGGRQAFHEFVLSGNEESLKRYYEAQRQSPILGSEEFVERIRQPGAAVTREHPRYERRAIVAGPEHVVREVMRRYKVTRDEILRSQRGRENEPRKVAMYLVKRVLRQKLIRDRRILRSGRLFRSELELSCDRCADGERNELNGSPTAFNSRLDL